jgi:hypothetical protein
MYMCVGALYPRVDNSSPPPTPTKPALPSSSTSMGIPSSFPSSISSDNLGGHSGDFFPPMTPIASSFVPVASSRNSSVASTASSSATAAAGGGGGGSGSGTAAARMNGSTLTTHSPVSSSPSSGSPVSSPTSTSAVAGSSTIDGQSLMVSIYPYTKHLKRVLKSALEDTRSFLSHMGVVLASDAVFGGTSNIPIADISRICHDTVSSQLYDCILPSLLPLYITANTSSDASLDRRRLEFQNVRFSRLGLSPSLCLDEPDVEMASRLPKKKKTNASTSTSSSSSSANQTPNKDKDKDIVNAISTATPSASSSDAPPIVKANETKNSVSVDVAAATVTVEAAPGYGQRDSNGRLKNPYQLAIDRFRGLANVRDPVAKLECVVGVAKSICVCVDQYRPASPSGGVVMYV